MQAMAGDYILIDTEDYLFRIDQILALLDARVYHLSVGFCIGFTVAAALIVLMLLAYGNMDQ